MASEPATKPRWQDVPHNKALKIITVNLPVEFLARIDAEVQAGWYASRSEAIRVMVCNQLREDLRLQQYVVEKVPEGLAEIKVDGHTYHVKPR